MDDPNQKREAGKYLRGVLAVLLALVLYVLSSGPALILKIRGTISPETYHAIYRPPVLGTFAEPVGILLAVVADSGT